MVILTYSTLIAALTILFNFQKGRLSNQSKVLDQRRRTRRVDVGKLAYSADDELENLEKAAAVVY